MRTWRFVWMLGWLMPACPAAAANLLANAGFEQHDAGWPTDFAGWGHMESIVAAEQGLTAHGGGRVLRGVDVYGDAYHAGGVHQFVPAAPGQIFRTQCYVYHHASLPLTGGSSLWIKLEFKDAGGTILASHAAQVMDAAEPFGTWRLAEGPEAAAPTGTASAGVVLVFLQPNATDSGAGFFDDALLERVDCDLVTFDLRTRGPAFAGFGAQLWGYCYNPAQQYQALHDLNIRHVRIERESASWTQMQTTRQMCEQLGIDWTYMIWEAPTAFVDAQHRLLDAQLPTFAQWWAAQVNDLHDHDVAVEYIELMNEPDSGGQWSTGISPAQYSALVQQVRTALDAYGLTDVRIVGPGTSNLANAVDYLGALDAAGVAAHDVWSAHGWGTYDSCGPACIQAAWSDFADAAGTRDPNLPQFVTEYATHARTWFGVTYPDADDYGDWDANAVFPYYSVTNTMPYAVRVYGNTLGLLNAGANAVYIWQLIDFPSAVEEVGKAWGLLDLWGNPKPVYGALETLFPEIPVGAAALAGAGVVSDVQCGAYVCGNRVVIGLANETQSPRIAAVRLTNAACVQVLSATAFVPSYTGDPALGEPDIGVAESRDDVAFDANFELHVTLPALSTLTIVATVTSSATDLDGDGSVSAGDLLMLEECLAGPDVQREPACACSDLDGDMDVDLGEYVLLQQALGA